MVKIMTHKQARNFETLKLKNFLKPPEVIGICNPLKLSLPHSQVLIKAGKRFHCKVLRKLYRNNELNILVNFKLIVSDPKVSQS